MLSTVVLNSVSSRVPRPSVWAKRTAGRDPRRIGRRFGALFAVIGSLPAVLAQDPRSKVDDAAQLFGETRLTGRRSWPIVRDHRTVAHDA